MGQNNHCLVLLQGKKTPAVTLSGTLPSLSPTSPSLPPAKVPDPCTDGLDALMFGEREGLFCGGIPNGP